MLYIIAIIYFKGFLIRKGLVASLVYKDNNNIKKNAEKQLYEKIKDRNTSIFSHTKKINRV